MKYSKILMSMTLLFCLAVQTYAQPSPGSPSIIYNDPAIREMEQSLGGYNPVVSPKGTQESSSLPINQNVQNAFPDYKAKTNDFLNGAIASGYYTVTVPEFVNRTKIDTNWMIVDIRPADVYAQGHIENATNVPVANLISMMGTIPSGKRIAVCGSTNTDAAFGVMALNVFGGREAYVLLDGINAWQQAGMPVVT